METPTHILIHSGKRYTIKERGSMNIFLLLDLLYTIQNGLLESPYKKGHAGEQPQLLIRPHMTDISCGHLTRGEMAQCVSYIIKDFAIDLVGQIPPGVVDQAAYLDKLIAQKRAQNLN